MKHTDQLFQAELERLAAAQLLREPDSGQLRAEAMQAAAALGVRFIDASSNDYLGLASAIVSRETLNTLKGVPAGSGASRLIHGSRSDHEELERELADWVRQPCALLFSSGYAANVGLMAALGQSGSLIVSDALNHASIIDGCRLSKAAVRVVPHLDLEAVERALRASQSSSRWVVTESYFSMDGDGPDLAALANLCARLGAGLVVDEAHALGVFGPEGAGRCAEAGVVPDILIGTLGKSVGLQGAFVAGSESLRRFLWNRARSFVFSTAPTPVLASLSVLHVKRTRQSEGLRSDLRQRSTELRDALRALGVSTLPASFGPIVPVLAGSNERALAAAGELRAQGILTQAIRPPTVPEGTARLRVTVTATLSKQDVVRLAEALAGRTQTRASARAPGPAALKTRRIVVLGTGTGIGKTRVAAALAAGLRRRGARVLALKPVESGVPGAAGDDATLLARAAQHALPPGAWVLREPVSPHLASEREEQALDVQAIVAWVEHQEAAALESGPTLPYVIIETAGGVFSPLTLARTNFDLASALRPDCWILVAPDSLGVLHDVAATLGSMRARGREPDHLVLSAARAPDASTGTNARELGRVGSMTPLTVLARDDDAGIEALVSTLLEQAPR